MVLGILSVIFSLLFALIGLVLGIIGLVLASSHQKEANLNYNTEKILNIVGIAVSAINMVAGFMMAMNALGY
ncbi:DUF4190 domain-containing protein [Streptococcus panodentis]|uniref:DUF4190 domain-containing protein n=1 Tax=Streptococcus TaxID=1301 RepID=UPI000793AE7A|nr:MULTISPECIES: DUF4190 domain-containing protein [Streptococcus]KXT81627.1 hypothetical protein STRDD11_01994 [Streptococcus sp. DD11]